MMRGETAKLLSYCTGTPDTSLTFSRALRPAREIRLGFVACYWWVSL